MPALQASQVNAYLTRKLLQDLTLECTTATQVILRADAVAGSDDGTAIMVVPSDITLDITTSGVNGLDTGSEAANTWYYIYVIYNPTTGDVAGLLSASPTSPTLPSGYTKKRLVGAVQNKSGLDFRAFIQEMYHVELADDVQILAAGNSTTATEIDVSTIAPPGLAKVARVYGELTEGADSANARRVHLAWGPFIVGWGSRAGMAYRNSTGTNFYASSCEIDIRLSPTATFWYYVETTSCSFTAQLQGYDLNL